MVELSVGLWAVSLVRLCSDGRVVCWTVSRVVGLSLCLWGCKCRHRWCRVLLFQTWTVSSLWTLCANSASHQCGEFSASYSSRQWHHCAVMTSRLCSVCVLDWQWRTQRRFEDSARNTIRQNTVEENSSVLCITWMRWLLSSRTCGQHKCSNKILQFLAGNVC